MNLGLYQSYNQDPNLLSIEEIAGILGQVDDVIKWANDIKEYALEEALKGVKFPG